MDLQDGRELFPDSLVWTSHRREEQQDDETVHILEASLPPQPLERLNQVLNWNRSTSDTVHLTRTAELKKKETLFGSNWSFEMTFFSRRFDDSYGSIWEHVPEECGALEDDQAKENLTAKEVELLEDKFALGILQWNKARFERRFDKVWAKIKAVQPDTVIFDDSIFEKSKVEWEKHLHKFLSNLEINDPTVVDLNWWDETRTIFVEKMTEATGDQLKSEIANISDALENEYQITKDLEDDRFNFKVDLPGSVTESSGTEENGWLVWSFNGRDLLNENQTLSAISFKPSVWKIGVAAFVAIVLLNFLRRGFRGRKKVELKFH